VRHVFGKRDLHLDGLTLARREVAGRNPAALDARGVPSLCGGGARKEAQTLAGNLSALMALSSW